jgi:hypothetical protein
MASRIPGLQWRASGPSENMGSGKLAGLLRVAINQLRAIMPVTNDTRLARALRLLDSINSNPTVMAGGDPEFLERVAAAHRTAWEFFLVMFARSLSEPFASPFTRDRLAAFLQGMEVEVTPGNTTPRNLQFEAYVAAILILGGAEVTHAEPPDLQLLFGRERVGLAVKRVTSLNQRTLEQRVDEAVDQIRKSGLRGFVVLNLDSRFTDIDPEVHRPLLLDEYDRRFDELYELAQKCARVPEVLGIMSHGYAARWDMSVKSPHGLPSLRKSVPMRWVAFGDTEEDRDLFEEFSHAWTSRLTNRFDNIMKGEYI